MRVEHVVEGAVEEDVSAIVTLWCDAYPALLPHCGGVEAIDALFRRRFAESSDAFGFLVSRDTADRVIGWASLFPCTNDPCLAKHVGECSIVVSPSSSGRGVGASLLQGIHGRAARCGVSHVLGVVHSPNNRALALIDGVRMTRLGALPASLKRPFEGELQMVALTFDPRATAMTQIDDARVDSAGFGGATLRGAVTDDAAAVASLWIAAARSAARSVSAPEELLRFFFLRLGSAAQSSGFWVAERDGRVVGWVSLLPCRAHPFVVPRMLEVNLCAPEEPGVGLALARHALGWASRHALVEHLLAFCDDSEISTAQILLALGFVELAALPQTPEPGLAGHLRVLGYVVPNHTR